MSKTHEITGCNNYRHKSVGLEWHFALRCKLYSSYVFWISLHCLSFSCVAENKALEILLGCYYTVIRLDIVDYLDPASNPGSYPQRLSDRNCKSYFESFKR